MKPSRIYLIGPMGAGKSTIGRHLAGTLNMEFFDTDAEIERRCGADIPWIFDVEGEAGFRQREIQVLEDLSHKTAAVIATGGGIVMRDENRACLNRSGFVVYLEASEKQLLERTARDKKRPLLQVEDPVAVMRSLMEIREPVYLELADLVVKTDKRSPKRVASDVAEAIARTENG